MIAQVIGIGPHNTRGSTTAYDPTCGSGSLLLKLAAQAGKQITLEGQEKDVTTAGLARMNLILHDFPTANIVQGDTLAAPKFKDGERLRTYDYVVANPPFSDKTWSTPASRPPTTAFSALPGACRPPSRATTPICCTSSARSTARARGPASCPTACSFAATPRR